jgi:hypothetical protein
VADRLHTNQPRARATWPRHAKQFDLTYKTQAGFSLCLTELPDNETLVGKGAIAAKDRKIMKHGPSQS